MWSETSYLWLTNSFFRVSSIVFIVGVLLLYFHMPGNGASGTGNNQQPPTSGQGPTTLGGVVDQAANTASQAANTAAKTLGR